MVFFRQDEQDLLDNYKYFAHFISFFSAVFNFRHFSYPVEDPAVFLRDNPVEYFPYEALLIFRQCCPGHVLGQTQNAFPDNIFHDLR